MVLFCFMLSETLIKEFREIFSEEYNLNLEEQEAAKAAVWLASYFDLLAHTKTEEVENNKTQKINKFINK